MPEIKENYLLGLSKQKTGFQRYNLEKVYRLVHIMQDIENDKELNKLLAIKGGTAINFIYYKTPRLSVDIDLNYVGSAEKEIMLSDYLRIDKLLHKIVKAAGYAVKPERKYALLRHYLNYIDVKGNKDNIKIEINFLERVPAREIIRQDFKHIFDVSAFKVNTYCLEELFASKLRALIRRGTPRDLFDVHRLKEVKYDKLLLKKLFIFYTSMAMDVRKIDLSLINKIDEEVVQRNLIPLLPKGTKFDVSKAKKEVLVFLSKLMKLTQKENEFIKQLYDYKVFKPELLFKRIEANPLIIEHPSIKLVLKKLEKK